MTRTPTPIANGSTTFVYPGEVYTVGEVDAATGDITESVATVHAIEEAPTKEAVPVIYVNPGSKLTAYGDVGVIAHNAHVFTFNGGHVAATGDTSLRMYGHGHVVAANMSAVELSGGDFQLIARDMATVKAQNVKSVSGLAIGNPTVEFYEPHPNFTSLSPSANITVEVPSETGNSKDDISTQEFSPESPQLAVENPIALTQANEEETAVEEKNAEASPSLNATEFIDAPPQKETIVDSATYEESSAEENLPVSSAKPEEVEEETSSSEHIVDSPATYEPENPLPASSRIDNAVHIPQTPIDVPAPTQNDKSFYGDDVESTTIIPLVEESITPEEGNQATPPRRAASDIIAQVASERAQRGFSAGTSLRGSDSPVAPSNDEPFIPGRHSAVQAAPTPAEKEAVATPAPANSASAEQWRSEGTEEDYDGVGNHIITPITINEYASYEQNTPSTPEGTPDSTPEDASQSSYGGLMF